MRYLKNYSGMTLTELLVAMAISGVLLIGTVSASLFLQRYLSGWEKQDVLSEELAFISVELGQAIASASDIHQFPDGLLVVQSGRKLSYTWAGGIFRRDGHRLGRSGVSVSALSIHEISLPETASDSIFLAGNSSGRGLFRMRLVVSTRGDKTDSLITILRNDHEYFKYLPQ